MTSTQLSSFAEVWLVDFEFHAPPGERPMVVCLVAKEFRSGRYIRLWQEELYAMREPPYNISKNSLFVAYFASAEMGCHLSLGWDLPINVLDLYVEFRNSTNGLEPHCGNSLLGALAWHGLDATSAAEKDEMRDLAIRGGPWTTSERLALLKYCQSDVDALEDLLPKMADEVDLPRALQRGRYMNAVARIEHTGVPIDTATQLHLTASWESIQDNLISKIDEKYNIYEGRSFVVQRFEAWLSHHGIPWPRLTSGMLDLKAATFKIMALQYPDLAPLHELRESLAKMRKFSLQVGRDGRNRCLLSPYRSRTGRNQPSNSKHIFGASAWMRSLIKPPPGHGLAYIDWCQQEFGIAAALSKDDQMMLAYESGDPYMTFAIQAGAAPKNATKSTHGEVRALFKACVLAVQYGMGAESLAGQIGHPVSKARELLRLHRATYSSFWAWSDSAEQRAMLHGRLWTVFGWQVRRGADPNPRFFRNFPMQANGAEMLRLACCMVTERGIRVCAPVHDAMLIEAPLDLLEDHIIQTQLIMRKASGLVLSGFYLRSDVDIVRYPERYIDERGEKMWSLVSELLETPPGH